MTRQCILWAVCCTCTALAWAGGQPAPFKSTPDEVKVFELTNDQRKTAEAPALKLSAALNKIARAHSENMARQQKMAHILDGKTPFDRMRDAGFTYARAGENVGTGDERVSLPMLMKAWMDSEGHRKNILQSDFTEMGVGIARDKNGQVYYTQLFAKPRQ